MNLNNDIVYCCLWLGPLCQFHPGCSGSLVGYNYRFHNTPLFSIISKRPLWGLPVAEFIVVCNNSMKYADRA
jgi:hypothetical protein